MKVRSATRLALDRDVAAHHLTEVRLMATSRPVALAKYTFDMGGAGDLLSLSLNVPPWEDLYELSREELRQTNLVTTDMIAEPGSPNVAVVELTPKSVQDRFASSAIAPERNPQPAKSTKAAESMGPTSGVRAVATSPGQELRAALCEGLLRASQESQ